MRAAGPRAEIDLDAFRHNLRRVRELRPDRPVMAVVKAAGYGHGLGLAVQGLADADALAVARVGEGVAARMLEPRKRIVVLEGAFDGAGLNDAGQYRLELVVHNERQIAQLERADGRFSYRVWLKVDTGMHRLGFTGDIGAVHERLASCASLAGPPALMTHLACADERADSMTRRQLDAFAGLVRGLPGEISIGNSAAILAWSDDCEGWVRPGIMLYGISPVTGTCGPERDLRPVMTLCTELIAIRRVRAGATVGYGGTWRAAKDTFIGTVAAGYGDGYPGNLPNGTPVLVAGRRVPLAGRVSMDMATVDLGAEAAAQIGDEVVLWGRGLPVEEIALACGRIPYELVCGVSQRVPRVALSS